MGLCIKTRIGHEIMIFEYVIDCTQEAKCIDERKHEYISSYVYVVQTYAMPFSVVKR